MADVGKNIRHLRIQKHMTQDELAERLFVSRQTVSHYETGKSNPDIDMLLKIAEVFQTDVTVLIFGTSDMAERRKDVRRLAAAGAVLMVLVLFYLFAVPRARSLQMSLYIFSLILYAPASDSADSSFAGMEPGTIRKSMDANPRAFRPLGNCRFLGGSFSDNAVFFQYISFPRRYCVSGFAIPACLSFT